MIIACFMGFSRRLHYSNILEFIPNTLYFLAVLVNSMK
jgi:hypothetical protein